MAPLSPAWTGTIMALAATAGWSVNYLFARVFAGVVPPFTLILLRTLVALALFAPFGGRDFLRDWPVIRKRLFFNIFLALTGLGLFNALIYIAGSSTSVINMALIATTSPIFVLLLGRILFGEPLSYRQAGGILAAIAGIALLAAKGDLVALGRLTFQKGDIIMLVASFFFACYTVGMRVRSADVSNNASLFMTFLFSALFITPLSAGEILMGKPVIITPTVVAAILYLGAVASIFCYWCWTNAIIRIGPGKTALFYYSVPLFSGMEAVLFLGERLLWSHLAGGCLIIAGVVLATRR